MKKILLSCFITTIIACTPTKQSTIDTTLQSKVDSILQNKMSEINAISGQAIVMDIQANEVKAIVGNGQKQTFSLIRAVSINKALETGKIVLSDSVDTEEGVAISGTAFALGSSTYFGDWEFRSKLLRTAEMAGGTNKGKGKRCYRLGEIFITGEATALAMRTNIKR